MVRVLLFGATGFVGNEIARALRRQAHTVYAVARSEEKTLELAKQELIPILADISEAEAWVPVLDNVDIVIDSSPSYGGISEGILKAIKASDRVQKAKKFDPKLGLIYVSGVWVHGDSPELRTDRVPAGLDKAVVPPDVVAWRPAFEESLLQSREILDVTILRAGMVFGGSGSLCSLWWGPFVEALKATKAGEPVEIVGNPEASMALVHKDDYAEAVLNTVERFELVSQIHYPVFDIISGHEKLGDINRAAAKVLEITGEIKYKAPGDPFSVAVSTSLLLDNNRAINYLGWTPKHTSLIKDANAYVRAYLYSTDYLSHMEKLVARKE